MSGLPETVPVFAVSGVLLLPGHRLPLTVFEPRYLALTDDCLGAGRLLALVQPSTGACGPAEGLYGVGTLARIVAFGETGDGRYLITCHGVSRFRVVGEAEGRSGYRRVVADYTPFAADGDGAAPEMVDRIRLLRSVGGFLAQAGLAVDMSKLDQASDRELVDSLAMVAPLSPGEKQALLEAVSVSARAELMIAIFEMAAFSEGERVRH